VALSRIATAERYELRDEDGELIRVFMSHEEAIKHTTGGDYLVKKSAVKLPRVSPYETALKRVGEALF
jgi:hypothetical protein